MNAHLLVNECCAPSVNSPGDVLSSVSPPHSRLRAPSSNAGVGWAAVSWHELVTTLSTENAMMKPAASLPSRSSVWKGALTKNTHSHINVRGKKCSNKGDIKAQLRVRGRHRRVLKNTCWWKRLRSEGTAGKGSYVWKSVEASWGMQIA